MTPVSSEMCGVNGLCVGEARVMKSSQKIPPHGCADCGDSPCGDSPGNHTNHANQGSLGIPYPVTCAQKRMQVFMKMPVIVLRFQP
jgi:hypothetical protein